MSWYTHHSGQGDSHTHTQTHTNTHTHTLDMLITSVEEMHTPSPHRSTPDHLHTLTLLVIVFMPVEDTHFYTFSTSSLCWSAWSIGNPDGDGPNKGHWTPARRQGRADNDKHPSWSAGGKWGNTKPPGSMIRCDVGCVISGCSNSYCHLRWQDQLCSVSKHFLSVHSVAQEFSM